MIALIAAILVALTVTLSLARLVAGPTLYDRALAANAIIMRAALVCAALAVAWGRSAWLDVSLALAIGALVVSAATLKFFRSRSFQPSLAQEEA
jgi:multicomponent Na+:H+ antiporter subunit F